MLKVSKENIIQKLNDYSTQALQRASEITIERGHYEVTVSHFILAMLEQPASDVSKIFKATGLQTERFEALALKTLDQVKAGAIELPEFAPLLLELLQDALTLSSGQLDESEIRTGAILAAITLNPNRYCHFYLFGEFEKIDGDALLRGFSELTRGSMEGDPGQGDAAAGGAASALNPESALAKFGRDLVAAAKEGQIDPVFCRDQEIGLMTDVLSRRRKNNPILVGDPGVGKTALAEGLALKIVEGDIPASLEGVRLWELDLGALQAGASVKGEFERRLKAVLDEVTNAPEKIVLFIDEAHTLIGGGGQAGGSDAANLLKPALARGQLRAIAATTWSEYKKYFEKDAALARRFQLIKLDEPSVPDAVTILRGMRNAYEERHNVYISDAALGAAANLSDRYLTGRFLPDKALDVLDTACVRVASSQTTKPRELDGLTRKLLMLEQELSDRRRDQSVRAVGAMADTTEIERQIDHCKAEVARIEAAWSEELAVVKSIVNWRGQLSKAEQDHATDDNEDTSTENDVDLDQTRADIENALAELRALRKDGDALVEFEVGADIIAKLIEDWTGVPAAAMSDDDVERIVNLGDGLKAVVCGQDLALNVVHDRLKAARLDFIKSNTPRGVFLLVGSSGVGKTETAEQVAIQLFGGKQFLTVINMSEYQEKHTVSRLIGSPPGYVGFGEGGVLTEAIRRAPYSVVLLDEVEKAHPDVLNIFYQAFDKGVINDGEGREIDCKNAIFFLTSNLGSDALMQNRETVATASMDALEKALRPHLQEFFKPALLARMQILAFKPLEKETLRQIIDLKLDATRARLQKAQRLEFAWDDEAIAQIESMCSHAENGARMIEQIIDKWILPHIADEALSRLSARRTFKETHVSARDGGFVLEYLPADEQVAAE